MRQHNSALHVSEVSAGQPIAFALPEEYYNKIKELADDTYRTVPSYLRMVVYNYLRRLDRPDTEADDWWMVK